MSDNRKYYYLKLKENYFDDDSIVLLESMQDGVLYSNILLKLYLKSLKHGGRLQLDEDIPYTAQMIATITRQQIGTVERALQIFLKLGLVEVLDSGTFYMSNIELLIGQSSTEAERKRAARLQNKALSAPRTSGGHLSDIRPPEIEIELEKEIEIKREIEIMKIRKEAKTQELTKMENGEQLTFEFEQRPTIKGFPELRWTGKRPYRSTQYYPAQLRETYGKEQNGWINKIFWGDNLQVMSHLLKEYT
jgi:predicted phage replisome organizer